MINQKKNLLKNRPPKKFKSEKNDISERLLSLIFQKETFNSSKSAGLFIWYLLCVSESFEMDANRIHIYQFLEKAFKALPSVFSFFFPVVLPNIVRVYNTHKTSKIAEVSLSLINTIMVLEEKMMEKHSDPKVKKEIENMESIHSNFEAELGIGKNMNEILLLRKLNFTSLQRSHSFSRFDQDKMMQLLLDFGTKISELNATLEQIRKIPLGISKFRVRKKDNISKVVKIS